MLRVTDFSLVILNEVKNLAEAKTDVKCGRLIIAPRVKCAYSIVILSVSEISRGSENGR